MPELKHLAEWLGIEVVMVEDEGVVRQRVTEKGLWVEREARATAVEMQLYDAVRGLVAVGQSGDVWGLVARALGLTPEATVQELLECVAQLHADNRHWREKAVGCDEELVVARKKAAALVQNVEQLKADRWVGHRLGSPPYYRNEGEQNAFTMVLHLLKTGEYPL